MAGGSGSRMGGGIPKQFRNLCGRPVLWWSIKAFHDENPTTEIVIVLPEEFISLWNDFFSSLPEDQRFPHKVTSGGSTRSESVRNGLTLIQNNDSLVAIHDGARPLVSPSIISEGWKAAEQYGAAIPTVPVVDSIRVKLDDNNTEAVNRDSYMIVQTPQVFKTALLKEAYLKAGSKTYSDDATVAEMAGHFIAIFPGNYDNIKITNPKDLALATFLMGKDG